jgi:hypothetical protein
MHTIHCIKFIILAQIRQQIDTDKKTIAQANSNKSGKKSSRVEKQT